MAAEAAVTLQSVVIDKYAAPDSFDAGFLLHVPMGRNARVKRQGEAVPAATQAAPIDGETVSEEQRKQLKRVVTASVPGEGISSLSSLPHLALAQLLPRLQALDVQGNALSLGNVWSILSTCSHLTTLDAGGNALGGPCPSAPPSAPLLATLSLNASGVAADSTAVLVAGAPHLTALHVCSNGWCTLSALTPAVLPALQRLHVGGNPLSSLQAALQDAGALPALTHLDVADCTFARQPQDPDPSPGGACLSPSLLPPSSLLSSLTASGSALLTWAAVDAVGSLALPTLRLLRLPAFEPVVEEVSAGAESEHGAVVSGVTGLYLPRVRRCGLRPAGEVLRQLVVARCPGVTSLNGSTVSDGDKVGAERFSARYHCTWSGQEGTLGATMAPVRLLGAWQEAHGVLGPLADVDLSAPSAIQVEVRYVVGESDKPVLPSRLVALDGGHTVGQVREQLLAAVPAQGRAGAKLVLKCLGAPPSYGPWELAHDAVLISSERPEDGDIITVVLAAALP